MARLSDLLEEDETVSEKTTHVGWIGTGVMGLPMCRNLLTAGYPVNVHNRSRNRAEGLIEAGATWRPSPAEVAADANVIFSIVGFPSDVREVILGADGVLSGARPGSVIVDMTTSEPSLAEEIHEAARARDVDALDAPVSGGDIGARDAALVVMVGGSEPAFQRVLPLLEKLGREIVYAGGPGAGQHTKMVNQIAIASGMVGVCEALLYAYRAGLDLQRVLHTISGGAAGSWSLTNYAPRMLRRDFSPGFKVEHFLKDLRIALDEAARMSLALPGLALVRQLYIALQAQGGGQLGTHALVIALARLSDVDWHLGTAPATASTGAVPPPSASGAAGH
jgi:3-hydroxyisobutyrate dehydrogenase